MDSVISTAELLLAGVRKAAGLSQFVVARQRRRDKIQWLIQREFKHRTCIERCLGMTDEQVCGNHARADDRSCKRSARTTDDCADGEGCRSACTLG